jgi:hypothetical protein
MLWYLENSAHPFSREPDLIGIAVLQESWWKLQVLKLWTRLIFVTMMA